MWTRVDTGLRDHRKVRKLARSLEIEQAHALGLVVNFWLFALNNWGHGFLDNDADEVAHACVWHKDPDDLLFALIDVGFLEKMPNNDALKIHDWDNYGGKYIKQVERNRDRAAAWREEKKERKQEAKEITQTLNEFKFSDLVDKKSL
jgi:hypothetical protein|tara:strand:+ start:2286 stop:2726 length:441 start_codon:yes stop_codon:yes gene_type:complete